MSWFCIPCIAIRSRQNMQTFNLISTYVNLQFLFFMSQSISLVLIFRQWYLDNHMIHMVSVKQILRILWNASLKSTTVHNDVIKWKLFRVTSPFTGRRRIPLTKASDAKLWRFLWSAPEQMFEQTIETFEPPSRSLWRRCNDFIYK